MKLPESAQADGFVTSFQDGYEMDLGQGGVNVSGGPEAEALYCAGPVKETEDPDSG